MKNGTINMLFLTEYSSSNLRFIKKIIPNCSL